MVAPSDISSHPYGYFHFPSGEDVDFAEFPSMNPSDIFLAGILALNASATGNLYLKSQITAFKANEMFQMDGEQFLHLASDKCFDVYRFLHLAFLAEACQEIKASCSEDSLYPLFQKQVSVLIPGAKIVPTVCGKHGRPDFCVENDGEIRPVEIKARKFTATNVRQLRRYMDGMKSSHGYAVAPNLGCVLPKDMTFVSIQFNARDSK